MEKIKHFDLNQVHRKVESADLIESTIREVQSILGFKKIIAFSGGGQGIKVHFEDKIIEKQIKEYGNQIKEKIIRDIMSRLKDYDVAILTGGTSWDIPEIATNIAREYGLPTIGVLPRRGEKSSMGSEKLNVEIIIDSIYGDSQYGDESPVFAKLSDGMFIIGGGAGTLIEFAHVMKINEALKKYGGLLKKIVPINGIPGVSDTLHYIPGNEDIKKVTFPNSIVNNGIEAFEWLKKELDLQEIYKETY